MSIIDSFNIVCIKSKGYICVSPISLCLNISHLIWYHDINCPPTCTLLKSKTETFILINMIEILETI